MEPIQLGYYWARWADKPVNDPTCPYLIVTVSDDLVDEWHDQLVGYITGSEIHIPLTKFTDWIGPLEQPISQNAAPSSSQASQG